MSESKVQITCQAVSNIIFKKIEGKWKLLLLKRATEQMFGMWCQVAGGIEDGERPEETALREIQEETELKPDRFYSADICEQFYSPIGPAIQLIPVFVAFIDDDTQEVVLNHEHSEFQWVDILEARELVGFPGQRKMLSYVWDEFIEREAPDCTRIF